MIRFAIIGAGHISKKHIQAIHQIPGAELVAVCDKNPDRLKDFSDDVAVYVDLETMLKEKETIDVVNICVPSGFHARVAKLCASYKKHLIIEKPLAVRAEEAEEIIRAAELHGVKLSVVHPNRFRPAFQQLKTWMDEGAFGSLSHGTATLRWNRNQAYYDQAAWRGTKALDGGVLMNHAIHNLDLLIWLMGPVESVQAMTATRFRDIESEDLAGAVLQFKSGALGFVEAATTIYPESLEESISIFGSVASVVVSGKTATHMEHLEMKGLDAKDKQKLIDRLDQKQSTVSGHQCVLEDMMLAIHEDRDPIIRGEDGLEAVRVIQAMYVSAETGTRVFLHSKSKQQTIAKTPYHQLKDKIENRKAVIGVVGLGYVGLPLAVEKASAGFQVIGFDVQQEKVDAINSGTNYISDVEDEVLEKLVVSEKLQATTDFERIQEVDAVAICVPTPLNVYQQPDTSYVESSVRSIARYAHEGMLVILESTTYPGTTEEIVRPILEEHGLITGETVFIAYSPERIDPGNKQFKTKNTPKVVGGVTEACTSIASSLYRSVLSGGVFEVSSPAVAEMEKIFENTFRHINIALANEMAILCERMNIDVWEVIDAAKTKPYGFMAFYPGPGLGGHCIPIDPFYLTYKAREYNYHTRLIELAGEINNSMPEMVVNRSMNILNNEGMPLQGSTIAVLGVAYKKDIDDVRESPALHIIEKLMEHGADVIVVDPHVQSITVKGIKLETLPLSEQLLEMADLSIIITDHSNFDYSMIGHHSTTLFDTRNAMKDYEKPENYYKL